MKKAILVLVLLAVACGMVFAGGGSQQQTTTAPKASADNTIRWSYWGNGVRITGVNNAIMEYFNRTGYFVMSEPAGGTGEHFDKFRTQNAGGFGADIVQTGGDFSNFGLSDQLVSAAGIDDLLLPLDQFVQSGVLDISKVDAAAIQAGTRSGKLYAIPVATNMPAMMYNKSLLERVGAPLPAAQMTWTEFDTWIRAVQAKLPRGTYALTDYSATSTGSLFFGYWCGDNNTPQWNGTRTMLTVAEVQKYFEMWARWRTDGIIPPAATSADYAETNESTSSMIAGLTAITVGWSNNIAGYQSATRDTLELLLLPNAHVTKRLWGQMSQMMAINKNSTKPEQAARFISYYVNDPAVWTFLGTSYGIPVTPAARSVLPTTDAAVAKQVAYLNLAGQYAGPRDPNMPSDTEWNSGLHLIAQNIAYGRRTAAQGAQDVMDLIYRLTNTRP